MKALVFTTSVLFFCLLNISAQTKSSIRGVVYDFNSQKELSGVSVKIENTIISEKTDLNGLFEFKNILPGTYYLEVFLENYELQKIPIIVTDTKQYNIGIIYLQPLKNEFQESSIILLSDDDLLDNGERSSDNIAGLFQSS
jgi:hypothetical protein